jgi:hypothetical protein
LTAEGGIDSPALRAHPFGAHFVRPKLSYNFVEPVGSNSTPDPGNKKKGPVKGPFGYLAERVGFEPTKGY